MMNNNQTKVVAFISQWVRDDCGDRFKKGDLIKELKLESYPHEIRESKTKEKKLCQICLNKYCYIGKVIAIVLFKSESAYSVVNIIIDCGVPIRLNFIDRDRFKLPGAKHVLGPLPKNLKVGSWIVGESDISFLTCVDSEYVRFPVTAKVTNIIKLVKESSSKDFGKSINLDDSGDSLEIGINDIFVELEIKKIGKLQDDVKGRPVLKLLK